MRFSQSLLLASVAILTLPSCSSAQGPGQIGTTDDIVVRNFGDAPLPPPNAGLAAPQGAAETVLQQEAGTPPEMMATRTQEQVQAEITANADEAQAAAAQHQAAVTAQAPQADAAQAQMQAAADQGMQVGQTQMQQQAALAAQQQQQLAAQAQQQAAGAGLEAVPNPVMNNPEPSLAEQATQTMAPQDAAQAAADTLRPAETVAGTAGAVSPEVQAGLETRAAVQADQPGAAIGTVTAPVVDQAAEEFQAKGPAQAAAEALQSPPTPSNAIVDGRPAPRGPNVNTQAADAAPVPAPVSAPAVTAAPVAAPAPVASGALRPTPEDIARGGMRVVTTNNGQVVEKAFEGVPSAAAPMVPAQAPAAPAPQVQAPAPKPTPAAAPAPAANTGAPVIDKAMIVKAQGVLSQQGLYTGPADGEMSTATLNALSRYQSTNHLTPGAMTVETARHMGLIQ